MACQTRLGIFCISQAESGNHCLNKDLKKKRKKKSVFSPDVSKFCHLVEQAHNNTKNRGGVNGLYTWRSIVPVEERHMES